MGLSAEAKRLEIRINWRSTLTNARGMALNLDFLALNFDFCYVHIFNFGFFSSFFSGGQLLWLEIKIF